MITLTEKQYENLMAAKARLDWLHQGGGRDPEGYEWGVFRVKWSKQGQPLEVLQTLSDFSDLDREMERERSVANFGTLHLPEGLNAGPTDPDATPKADPFYNR